MNSSGNRYKRKPLYSYFGFYIAIFGLAHLLFGSYSVFMKSAPEHFGVEATAKLDKKEAVKFRRKLVKYYFNYSFTGLDGVKMEGRNLVTPEFYKSIEDGASFKIKYLPSVPSAHYIPGSSSAMMACTILIMGFIITIVGVMGLTMHLQRERESYEELVRGMISEV